MAETERSFALISYATILQKDMQSGRCYTQLSNAQDTEDLSFWRQRYWPSDVHISFKCEKSKVVL